MNPVEGGEPWEEGTMYLGVLEGATYDVIYVFTGLSVSNLTTTFNSSKFGSGQLMSDQEN